MQLFQHIAQGGQLHVGSAYSPTDGETTNLASDYVPQPAAPIVTRETNSSSLANRNLFADVEPPATHAQHASQQPRSKSSIPRTQP